MESYQTLRILHGIAAVLPLLAIIGLAWYGWRSWRGGDAGKIATALQRIGLAGWVLVAGSIASLPVTGWQMVHSAGWPLGQTWLLASACLLIVATIFWLLFTTRLWRVRELALVAQASGEPIAVHVAREWKFGLAFFVLALACVIAILALMVAKPV
ncbi:DUF2269 domain-containing protein [Pseudomonas sp. ZM23]|uniref:DUF2269 domain-containing protein n=1 Tax=Pseudomonas triclosanedens TaxID=2961893 RepID=A0ABY6ZYE7_9PSED|nr:DUF2269 domain-containing protein [Pseudomonas triclosanedens]MCP8466811.1 DUF2269 domain-containing protein [Pseudomonas triclosanedens]MCP8470035.1 DUF2269 domain-containing protein [Pseudomonas triclosanedens]MCP8477945.1 DUF2269 domain-containing protein [Pseudomonas triclosanedens]WAI49361.1 DUF2269 domain-containing protein [Pseudomonas triclosanedens]